VNLFVEKNNSVLAAEFDPFPRWRGLLELRLEMLMVFGRGYARYVPALCGRCSEKAPRDQKCFRADPSRHRSRPLLEVP
jgi:hypothetical protein